MIGRDPLIRPGVRLTAQRFVGRLPSACREAEPRQHAVDSAIRIAFQVILVADRQRLEVVLGEEIPPAAIV